MQRTLIDSGSRPGLAHRHPQPAARAAADADDHRDGRRRHRRHGGDLQRDQRGDAAAAAVRASRSPGAHLHRHAAVQVPVLRRRLPRLHRTADAIRAARRPTRIARSASATARSPSCCARAWCRGRSFRCSASSPMLGRDFSEADGRAGSRQVALASHAFWQQRLGGRADAIGKPVRLDGADYTVVGVMPPAERPARSPIRSVPDSAVHAAAAQGPVLLLGDRAAARKRGSPAGRRTSCSAMNRALFPIWKSSYQDEKSTWRMEDLKTNLVGDVRAIAGLSLAAVGAGLADRVRECVKPADCACDEPATGAGRSRRPRRVARTRRSVICSLRAACWRPAPRSSRLAIAYGGMQLLQTYGATYFPRTGEIRFDARWPWLMLALALSSALLFGLVPALNATGGTRR